MSARIITTENFRREAKKLIKKYRSLKSELQELSKELEENPRKGVQIGEEVYKIRLGVKSKGRGKSGGLRIITFLQIIVKKIDEEETTVYLLSIYDKSDFENVSESLLKNIIREIQGSMNQEDIKDSETEPNESDQEEE